MTESTPQHDQKLVSLIQHRAPTDATAFAKAVFSWRTIDAELAWISYDLPNEETSPDE
jgi:hypothetical protein